MKKAKKADWMFLALGIATFFLLFSPVYSFERSCCGHTFTQDMAVIDFMLGIPSCTSYTPGELLATPIKLAGLIMSLYWLVVGLGGVE